MVVIAIKNLYTAYLGARQCSQTHVPRFIARGARSPVGTSPEGVISEQMIVQQIYIYIYTYAPSPPLVLEVSVYLKRIWGYSVFIFVEFLDYKNEI